MTNRARKSKRPRCSRNWSAARRLAHHSKVDPLSGCHVWQSSTTSNGYPQISFGGRPRLAHRLAWTVKHGQIPAGLDVCHRCDERRCINPDHHFLETHHGNMADYKSKRRARLARALGDRSGAGGLAADVSAEELTPIRIYVRGVEIVGEAIIRPFDPRGKL